MNKPTAKDAKTNERSPVLERSLKRKRPERLIEPRRLNESLR